jgi:hypothetical protein
MLAGEREGTGQRDGGGALPARRGGVGSASSSKAGVGSGDRGYDDLLDKRLWLARLHLNRVIWPSRVPAPRFFRIWLNPSGEPRPSPPPGCA